MTISLGCSLNDYRSHPEWQALPVINIENPLYPGYLDGDLNLDLDYLSRSVQAVKILDGPYIDLNLGSPEPKARQLAVDKTLTALEYARRAGAEEMIFLSAFLPFIGVMSYERGWVEESIRSWKFILSTGPGVRISICNTFEYSPINLLEIVQSIGQPGFGLAFDIGHCHLWGKIDPLDWYAMVKSYCRVIYLHSNRGQADQHESIQTGYLAQGDLLPRLGKAITPESYVFLKYFDSSLLTRDLMYLERLWG